MTLKPWAIGPFELLQHAEGHRLSQGDFDRRMAFISFDNAIESTVTTYLSLHPSQRGGRQYSREDVAKWLPNFHSKLAFLERHAALADVSMPQDSASMVFYHGLRNELYHNGNGVTPDATHLDGIREAALWTFSLIFECDAEALLGTAVAPAPSTSETDAQFSEATKFLQAFLSAREALTELASLQLLPRGASEPLVDSLKHVAANGQDPSLAAFADDLRRAEEVTDALVEDTLTDSGATDLSELTQKLDALSTMLDERLRDHQREVVLAAMRATTKAASGNRLAGVIHQAMGSGRVASLVAYVATCRNERSLPFRQHMVIVDRASMADQFINAYSDWPGTAAAPARAARGEDLATLLQDAAVGAGPIVTTAQQILSQNPVYEHECLVAYDGYVNPPARLAQNFPKGTFIRFASTTQTKSAEDSLSFGELVHAYDLPQAVSDGFLLPVQIETPRDDASAAMIEMPHSAGWVDHCARAILADYRGHSEGKAVILVADTQVAQAMAARMNTELANQDLASEQPVLAAAIGSSMNSRDLQWTIKSFLEGDESPTFLVMTPAMLTGLDIPLVRTCYVTCKVPRTMIERGITLVSRPSQDKLAGRVVDYVNHSWDVTKP